MSWAQNLVYGGYDDWRLPSAFNRDGSGPCWAYSGEPHCTGSEFGHLYYSELGNSRGVGNSGPFINMQNYSYWFSTEATPDQNLREGYADNVAWEFAIHNSEQLAHNNKNNPDLYAWAVRDGDGAPITPSPTPTPTSVPEPSTFLLLGSGLVGFAFLRKRLKP